MRTLACPPARRAFQQARDALGRGVAPIGQPWLDRRYVHAVWIDSQAAAPTLRLALTGLLPAHALPARWWVGGVDVRLRADAAPYAQANAAAPDVLSRRSPQLHGTATALAWHELGGSGCLLTCAHVVAPDARAQVGDAVRVKSAGAFGDGLLDAWQPDWQPGSVNSNLVDAAVVRLDPGLFDALRREAALLPNGVAAWQAGAPVNMQSQQGPRGGSVVGDWAGTIRLDDGGSYYLADGVGYRAGSRPGDSGAAVWNGQDQLVGMNLADLGNAPANGPDSVFGPIQPVLQSLRIRLCLRGGAVPLFTPALPAKAPQVTQPSLQGDDRDVAARTIWAEARNQGELGMRAVACVINNRWKTRYRRRRSPTEVCLDRWQFSCWNANDPNLAKLRAVTAASSEQFAVALRLADTMLDGSLVDITHRARHYHAANIRAPSWALGHQPCAAIGDHLFYNDVL